MNVAVVPARGGSKRIPRKNIRPFAGRPMLSYSIAVAQKCGLFDRIIVSTDDAEIAEVAKTAGAEVPFLRPPALADDHTGTSAVIKHAIDWFAEQCVAVTHVCCIYATVPLLDPRYVQQGYEKLIASGKSFVFSVTSFPAPVQRALRLTSDGAVDAIYPQYRSVRSQDLEPAYHDAGQFYWGRAEAFARGEVVFSPASLAVILPRHLVQDIDTEEDWHRAELMYRAFCHRENGAP
jgi:pseudaminic acid cytidylyltransferase